MLPIAHKVLLEPYMGIPGQGVAGAQQYVASGDYEGAVREFTDIIGINFLGYKFSDGSSWWTGDRAISPWKTYTEIGLGIAGSWAANKFGVNKQIKKIPLVGKWIKL